jgi:sugar phosphate permease
MAVDIAASDAPKVSREDLIYRKVTWRLIPLLFLCYVAAYLDRVNVGFAKLQMLNDLQFSETVYGLGAGIFLLVTFYSKFQVTLSCTKWGRVFGLLG